MSLCDHLVLVQGDTSLGRTSLVIYLANISGNTVVRVNNHKQTDIQEYIGSYTLDRLLVFQLVVLTKAMQAKSWVILDELNLTPTGILEALRRVLDDNRELFILDTDQTIRAKPDFRGDSLKTETVLLNRSTVTQQKMPSLTLWTTRWTFIKLLFLILCFGLQETGTSNRNIKDE